MIKIRIVTLMMKKTNKSRYGIYTYRLTEG